MSVLENTIVLKCLVNDKPVRALFQLWRDFVRLCLFPAVILIAALLDAAELVQHEAEQRGGGRQLPRRSQRAVPARQRARFLGSRSTAISPT